MPQPPGNDSACRTGNGFQISNTRKSIKPKSKYFQLRGTAIATKPSGGGLVQTCSAALNGAGTPQPSKSARCWPDTSSITPRCGSFSRQYADTWLEAHMPIAA